MSVHPDSPWRACVAPMLDWTDRHCRHLHRLLTRRARLYTEMVTTGALLHGDVARLLRWDVAEAPVALQLGGSEPTELAACARLAQRWGYAEVNLNLGCPSPRVQRGAFGACLMREVTLVADCVRAMRDAVSVPVTVKHRIGLDGDARYEPLRDFVGTLAQAGCEVFIVHARAAWLQGLSPKENREVPPLQPDWAHRLKQDFPALTIVLNGGLTQTTAMLSHLATLDGVMVGREAYHRPLWLADWDAALWPGLPSVPMPGVDAVEQHMVAYMQREQRDHGTPWHSVARHMLGLRQGLPGARHWRRTWSNHHLRDLDPAEVMALAHRPEAP